jgi:DNA topoisomerase VI subunit B
MSASNEFDLQPDPRILPMLGEINLAQWRCLAELVDNSVDGFLFMLRSGGAPIDPEVSVNLPMKDDPSARVTVSDNGPGMAPDRLEKAVRAGWSGNNPVDSLGMFGMGFNIATARLGTITTVWTSRKGEPEEYGLRIDFDELRKQRHFRTPRLTRTKTDLNTSGTSITIERLKPGLRSRRNSRKRTPRCFDRTVFR